MRILLVSHDFLPRHPAGTEIYTNQLGLALRRRGHEVHVFTTEKDIGRTNLEVGLRRYGDLPVHELVNNLFYNEFQETWDYPPAVASFAEFLDQVSFDVVHFMHLMYLSVGCLEEVARRKLPVFYTLHDYWLQCPRFGQRVHADRSICHAIEFKRCGECMSQFKFRQTRIERALAKGIAAVNRRTGLDLGPPARGLAGRFGRKQTGLDRDGIVGWEGSPEEPAADSGAQPMQQAIEQRDSALRRRILPVVDRFIAPSEFLRSSFVAWGIPDSQIEYLRTGIDLTPFEGFHREPTDHVRVGFIGTVVPHKGLHVLLRAWARLPEELTAKHDLRLFGPLQHDPSYVKAIRALSEEVGAPLRGALKAEEVAGALREIDVLVVPSVWYENSPLIILEALATRTPLVVSDLGGMAELVEPGRSGERFEVGNPDSLAEVLRGYLEEPERLGRLYPEDLEVRSVDLDAERLEHLYEQAKSAQPAQP